MKKLLLTITLLLTLSPLVLAEQRFKPMGQRWETTTIVKEQRVIVKP
jgi:hypothetical protein